MNSRARVIGGTILIVAVLVLVAYRVQSSRPSPGERGARGLASAGDDVDLAGRVGHGEGIQARTSDPPRIPSGWSELPPALLEEVRSRPIGSMDVVLLDLDANADMVPWLNSLVSDDERGRAIAECRRTHERRQRGRCSWEQDVVLRRDPAGATSVAAVAPRTLPGQHDEESGEPMAPECQAWARCVAEAWKGQPGMFPKGADAHATTAEDGSRLISVRASVHHLEARGEGFDDYQARYEDVMARLQEKIRLREQAYAEAEDAGIRSKLSREGLYHNLLFERGLVEDYRLYLEYLREHGS